MSHPKDSVNSADRYLLWRRPKSRWKAPWRTTWCSGSILLTTMPPAFFALFPKPANERPQAINADGDFIAGKRELPDGFLVEVLAQ